LRTVWATVGLPFILTPLLALQIFVLPILLAYEALLFAWLLLGLPIALALRSGGAHCSWTMNKFMLPLELINAAITGQ
jgi:hypothetical protein